MRILPSLTLTLFAGTVLISSGCATRVGEFTVISTKNVELSRIDVKKAAIAHNVKGISREHTIICFPTGAPSLQKAIDNGLNKGGGDVMTSAKVEAGGFYIPLLYGQSWIEVEGDVINSTGSGSVDLEKSH